MMKVGYKSKWISGHLEIASIQSAISFWQRMFLFQSGGQN